MKRFYKDVAVSDCAAGFMVHLDAKPVATPLRAPLVAPSRALAEAIAAEWRAQTGEIKLAAMPLTRLAATAVDRVAGRRDAVIEEVVRYAATDLVCYRATAPDTLVARQSAAWQPLVDWVARRYGATLTVTNGVVPVEQPAAALAALATAARTFSDLDLTALHLATAATGSLVVALALTVGEIDATAATLASQLDECYQAEHWGEDREAIGRRTALATDITLATRLLALVRD